MRFIRSLRHVLNRLRDILGQVDEKTTLGYIYNPNTKKKTKKL